MELPLASPPGCGDGAPLTAEETSADAIALESRSVVFTGNARADLRRLDLKRPERGDIIIDVRWSGVSTGTEKLLWSGDMPPFPGMGYPLVPGYEAVGKVVWADDHPDLVGRWVFAPGAHCYEEAYGIFGASSSRIIIAADRVTPIEFEDPQNGVLLALAATAYHAIAGGRPPQLIVGHGVLGRLLARLTIALGAPPPVVWEIDPERADGEGYAVIDPACDGRTDYRVIFDVSGDAGLLDTLVAHAARRGEIVLAGFYAERLSFDFAPAFIKEARLRIAAEWKPEDLASVLKLIDGDCLSLADLITHTCEAENATDAYRTAFTDSSCLKMILDWRSTHDRSV